MPLPTKALIADYTAKKLANENAISAVASATAAQTHTSADVVASATALSSDLTANGPAVDLSTDSPPVVTYYAAATGDPGFTATIVRIA